MSPEFRKPAFEAKRPPPAAPITDNPGQRLEAMYLQIWATSMRELPFVNAALSVEAVGFRRWRSASICPSGTDTPAPTGEGEAASRSEPSGDWVGAVITPWFINLFLLPGGGNLWSDQRPGQRCHILFPVGPLEFIADHDPAAIIPSYQYCPLFAPPSQFASQAAARAAASAALEAMLVPPTVPDPRSSSGDVSAAKPDSARRAFLRRFARP
ncbi:MAG: [NiFe]-hydrogenase assembly chaperone HybE [Candidatus Accumulibacter sp.]|uniref:[NiFe]-hydrogenase assembly chaperone HybE n=1 Tax=Candidatus Accumulibacter proximus TaxID=2954385 RepID=A0A935UHD1_9PROT|nr:[NiFe]-hydrogenase assembly chaperone HybE [Candidatus Accumulibacter proximus]